MMKMISNKAEYEAIMARVDELVEIVDDNTSPTDKNYIELDFLADLIVTYEKEHYPIGKFLRSEAFVSSSLHEQEFA
jgi:antitoxin component HigA of HigAB toxin-antitoxin module